MRAATAADTLRDTPHYRRDVFRQGLARCGYRIGAEPLLHPEPQDVLLIWNRSSINATHADRYEAAGARVIVAENGYIGADRDGHQLYAIAKRYHLGAGEWTEGPVDRWSAMGVELEPWRADGDEIVVLPQRGIGTPGIAMPKTWPDDVVSRLRKVTTRPIRVRLHPGKERTDPRPDLRRAWAAVTWASGAGIKAIVAGIPMFFEMPKWIGGPAAEFGIDRLESRFLGDRLPMLRRLAWAQWSVAEIASGEPFKWLLG